MRRKLSEIYDFYRMKKRLSLFVYGVICNLPVSFCLSITSAFIGNMQYRGQLLPVDWTMFFINYGISFFIAMNITLFVPLIPIGKWFTALFNVDNHTFTKNIRYRLLATISYSVIYFLVLTPTLNVLNSYIFPLIKGVEVTAFKDGMLNLALNTPFMLVIGYLSSLLFDLPAYQVAHKIDPEF